MAHWTGETITLSLGPKWTYKLRLEEHTEGGPQSHLLLGDQTFDSQAEAQAAGAARLQAELEKRSK